MESEEGVAEIDRLERGLLVHGCTDSKPAEEEEEEPIIYMASFNESEEAIIEYQSVRWVMYSLCLMLAWGIGLFMLIYLPLRRYILRKDIRSRKFYVTPNAIVYKVVRPVIFPCFGNLKKEKYVLLPSVADIVIEQGKILPPQSINFVFHSCIHSGYLQSLFGVYSIRIENVGIRRSPSEDLQIQGVTNPDAFRKAVLMRLSQIRGEVFAGQVSTVEDVSTPRIGHSSVASMSPFKSPGHDFFPHVCEIAVLQKLEEVGSSVKRVQTLMEEQNSQILELAD